MGRSQETWNKREKEKKKQKKKEEKMKRKELRHEENAGHSGFDDMIAWVDADGNPTSTPPDPNAKREKINAEDIIIGIPSKDDYEEEETVKQGTVTFYDESKGFGFIKVKGSGDSLFTHVKSHIDEIKEGNNVTFDIVPGDKGPVAVNVKLLK